MPANGNPWCVICCTFTTIRLMRAPCTPITSDWRTLTRSTWRDWRRKSSRVRYRPYARNITSVPPERKLYQPLFTAFQSDRKHCRPPLFFTITVPCAMTLFFFGPSQLARQRSVVPFELDFKGEITALMPPARQLSTTGGFHHEGFTLARKERHPLR